MTSPNEGLSHRINPTIGYGWLDKTPLFSQLATKPSFKIPDGLSTKVLSNRFSETNQIKLANNYWIFQFHS